MDINIRPLEVGLYGYYAGILVGLIALLLISYGQFGAVLAISGVASIAGVIVGALKFASVVDSEGNIRHDSLIANALCGFLTGGVVSGVWLGLCIGGELGKANFLEGGFATLMIVIMMTIIPGCAFAGVLAAAKLSKWRAACCGQ